MYTYFASKAKKDGYVQIASIFEETAANEKEHAKIWYKLLNGGAIGSTIDNLVDAANGENYEWTDMYAGFAKEAKEEGYAIPDGTLYQFVVADVKKKEAAPIRLSISLKPVIVERIDSVAAELGLTRSGLIAVATREYCNRMQA